MEVGNLITHDMDEDLSSVFSFTQKDDPKGLAKASDCTVSCNSSCVDGDLLITRRDDVKKTSSIYDCCEVDPAECSTFSITQRRDNSCSENDDSLADPDFEPPSSSEANSSNTGSDTGSVDEISDLQEISKAAKQDITTDRRIFKMSADEISDSQDISEALKQDNAADSHIFQKSDTTPSPQCLSLLRKRERKPGCRQAYDKIHYCKFCGSQIRSKMSRHLLNVHADETDVKEILLMPKGSKERRTRLTMLTNEGNFNHNITVIQKGEGELVVGKRFANKSACDYTACEFCHRFESKKNLWRHMKSCAARKEYYESTVQEKSPRILAVKRGKALVSNAAFTSTGENTKELFERMRDDDIKAIVVSDELICREADLRMAALGSKGDWKQDDIYRVSQSVRTLGRMVQFARLTVPSTTLTKLIEPQQFDLLVEIARKMSTEKESPSLNVGRTIGILLKKVCMSKYCTALRAKDLQAQQDATSFKQLLEREWNDRVNRTAVRRMQSEKRMTVPTIPLTEDLQRFRSYLVRNTGQVSRRLKKHHSQQDWVLLAKLVLSRLILFNKRQRAEVRELKVSEYLARPVWKDDVNGEMSLALSPVDRLLADRYYSNLYSQKIRGAKVTWFVHL